MPDAQVELMRNSPLMTGNLMLWAMLPSSLLLFGFLVYLRRFFFSSLGTPSPKP